MWAGAQSVIVDLGGHGDDGVAMTDDANETPVRSPLEEKILEVLIDYDYNDGAGMHWHPSKTPTNQALRAAARLAKELAPELPEAETRTMVRITYQFGVNGPRHATAQLHVDVDTTVQQLQDDVERTTGGLVGITKVETREVTTASTPWVEVSAR